MDVYELSRGNAPIMMSIPHVGTHMPAEMAADMTDTARRLGDTDWHLDRLYDFAAELGISVLQATHSRYVIDLNRDPENRPLYPGASNTELVPTSTFAEEPLYETGRKPDEAAIAARRETYWRPYHEALAAELSALKAAHGIAVLFDCHSICSRVPRFFEGQLPDFNLGTGDGVTCADGLQDRLAEALGREPRYSLAVNGRFKGGYITRHYGRPDVGIHAFQLELSWATYMDEDHPFAYRKDLAVGVQPRLRAMLEAALAWAAEQ